MSPQSTDQPIAASGSFQIAGKAVHRLGYGTMQLTGEGVWGEPEDRAEAIRVLQRAVELGVPWFPIASGALAKEGGPVDDVVKATGAEPSQVALAWLLRRSPVMLPIPGTSSVEHLESNCRAATIELSDDQVDELTQAAG